MLETVVIVCAYLNSSTWVYKSVATFALLWLGNISDHLITDGDKFGL